MQQEGKQLKWNPKGGPKLLEPLLEHVESCGGMVARQRLSWVLDVNDMLHLTDRQEKEEAACELYELLNHCVLLEDYDIKEVYTGLQQSSISVCEEIESAFVSFLGTPSCSKLMHNLRKYNSYVALGPDALPLTDVKKDGLIATLDKLQLSQALSVVDRQIAGLPLVYVNRPFCELTGYSRAELVGKNCRILQGSSTEEVAVAKLVQAIRSGRPETVCIRCTQSLPLPCCQAPMGPPAQSDPHRPRVIRVNLLICLLLPLPLSAITAKMARASATTCRCIPSPAMLARHASSSD